jgi:hypothetical protein
MVARRSVAPFLPVVLGLPEAEAAAAVGVSVGKFRELVQARRMPRPRMIDSRRIYDVDELRQAFKDLPHDGAEEPADSDPWSGVAV